jgi:hypothetical protein
LIGRHDTAFVPTLRRGSFLAAIASEGFFEFFVSSLTRASIIFGAGSKPAGPNLAWLIHFERLSIPVAAPIVIMTVVVIAEIEQIEQVSDRRHVDGNIGILIVGVRIRQIIAAALGELAEMPVPFDEFHKGRMFIVDVADVTAP